MQDGAQDDLLKIGEFAKISDVSVKTLRYYDRIGLFQPVYVDPSTSYRYYSPAQLERLRQVLALKALGLSLKQIDQLMEDGLPPAKLRGMLRLRKHEIQDRLQKESARLDRVEARLRQIEPACLRARGEGGGSMRTCSTCARTIQERDTVFCPYCGAPLTSATAGLLSVQKGAKELAVKSLGFLLVTITCVALLASLVTAVADGGGAGELMFRAPSEASPSEAALALLSIRSARPEERGGLLFEGRVKNVSGGPLADVAVAVTLYDADPAVIGVRHEPIETGQLPPGNVSIFTVEMKSNPRAHSYRIGFQYPSGVAIPVHDARDE